MVWLERILCTEQYTNDSNKFLPPPQPMWQVVLMTYTWQASDERASLSGSRDTPSTNSLRPILTSWRSTNNPSVTCCRAWWPIVLSIVSPAIRGHSTLILVYRRALLFAEMEPVIIVLQFPRELYFTQFFTITNKMRLLPRSWSTELPLIVTKIFFLKKWNVKFVCKTSESISMNIQTREQYSGRKAHLGESGEFEIGQLPSGRLQRRHWWVLHKRLHDTCTG